MTIVILLAVIVGLVLLYVGMHNTLVRLRNAARQMFAQIDVELQRRNDLIPNLIETVKGYTKHEKETLDAVVKARQQLIALPESASNEQKLELSDQLSSSLGRLMAVSEAYPDLKANTNFIQLQEELTNTENRISGVRQTYNRSVMQYNTKIETIPTNFVASIGNFEKMTFLETPEAAKEVPKVSF